jgi:hypothetical protein
MKSILKSLDKYFILHSEEIRIGDSFGNETHWWVVTDIKDNRIYHTFKKNIKGNCLIKDLNNTSYKKLK